MLYKKRNAPHKKQNLEQNLPFSRAVLGAENAKKRKKEKLGKALWGSNPWLSAWDQGEVFFFFVHYPLLRTWAAFWHSQVEITTDHCPLSHSDPAPRPTHSNFPQFFLISHHCSQWSLEFQTKKREKKKLTQRGQPPPSRCRSTGAKRIARRGVLWRWTSRAAAATTCRSLFANSFFGLIWSCFVDVSRLRTLSLQPIPPKHASRTPPPPPPHPIPSSLGTPSCTLP